jgi:hypothetical protein
VQVGELARAAHVRGQARGQRGVSRGSGAGLRAERGTTHARLARLRWARVGARSAAGPGMGRGWRGCMVLGRGALARAGEAQEGGLGGPHECWAAGRIRKDLFLLFSFFYFFPISLSFVLLYSLRDSNRIPY